MTRSGRETEEAGLDARRRLERGLLERVRGRLARGLRPARPPVPEDESRVDLDEALRRLRLAARRWPGEVRGACAPAVAFNPDGPDAPLFWVFNGGDEPVALSGALGPRRPLYALRSLNELVRLGETKRRLRPDLAALYAAEAERLAPEGPLLIGGNCQAGPIAEAVARRLLDAGREVALLALLECQPAAPYPGRVAMFFGAESETHNPFLKGEAPEPDWRRRHGAPVWDVVPGRHGEYFSEPNLASFAARLAARIAEAGL